MCSALTRSHAHPHAARHSKPVSRQPLRRNRPVGGMNIRKYAINSVVKIHRSNPTRSFYDAFGRRIQTTLSKNGQPPETVQYLYEGSQALGEIRNGSLSHRLLTGLSLDETIARIAIQTNGQPSSANSRTYLTDALNSVIAQLNAEGNAVANSYAYSPYGESQTIGVDGTSNSNQYTSRENDNTGLYFYRARYYDPVIKRFINEDPIRTRAGLNFYAYVDGNPISMTDPLGLMGQGSGAIGGSPRWGKGGPCSCPKPPPGPPGACIANNIDIAKDYSVWNPGSWFALYENVKNYGPWDYKRQGSQYEDFGNFNFGAVTAAMGISSYLAQNGAGIYQQWKGASDAGIGTPLLSWPYGDDPRDAAEIERGRQYFKCKCR
jgi:RHS repeat-associated protein